MGINGHFIDRKRAMSPQDSGDFAIDLKDGAYSDVGELGDSVRHLDDYRSRPVIDAPNNIHAMTECDTPLAVSRTDAGDAYTDVDQHRGDGIHLGILPVSSRNSLMSVWRSSICLAAWSSARNAAFSCSSEFSR